MIQLCYAMVFFSGLTGLIYQVTWQKYLSVLLGSHAAAASIILALFFVFLAAGYAVLGRFANRISKNNLKMYGAFELIIGIYALYSPLIFRALFESYVKIANAGGEQDYLLGMLYCGIFILIPTFFMGGTVPVLVEALSADYKVSSQVHARIYATNTLGAFVGCLLAGFYLIEAFGLEDTLFIAGWSNILIAIIAFVVAAASKLSFEGPVKETRELSSSADRKRLTGIVLISFLSGFYVFSLEKLAIRMAGMVYGSSTYTYSMVVGAFILAIGVGSYLLSRKNDRLKDSAFSITMISSVVFLILFYIFIPYWPDWALRIRVLFQSSLINFGVYWFSVLVFTLFILIIPAGILGTNLPFLFSLLRKNRDELSTLVGRLYSINCLGSALGAIVGGYWLFKFFDASAVFKVAIFVLISSSMLTLYVFELTTLLRRISVALLLICSLIVYMLPPWPTLSFVPGKHLQSSIPADANSIHVLDSKEVEDDILFAKYDPNTMVAVTKMGEKDRVLYVNGKPDAATTGDHTTRAYAALNPIALIPHPVKNIFIAGLGAGLSMSIASKFAEVEMVEVAEISEAVKDALPYFDDFNFNLQDRKEKFKIEVGDAYKILLSKNKRYDLILCEPSNPWVTGVEKLFSTEFYQQVRGHLNDGGVFAQWFPLFSVDEETFLTILNTYASVFPWVSVWSGGGASVLTIIGSEKPLEPNFEWVKKRFEEQRDVYAKFDINDPMTIMQLQMLTPAQVKLLTLKVRDTQSAFNPTLEFKAGRGLFANLNVNLSDLLYRKALLPYPDKLGAEVFPAWKNQGLEGNLTSYNDFLKIAMGATTFHSLRQSLLAYENEEIRKAYPKTFEALEDYRYLLDKSEMKALASGETVEKKVVGLSLKMRELQAIGYRPKLSRITRFLEEKCGAEEQCLRSKYAVIGWFSPPAKAKSISNFKIESVTREQKRLIESLYTAAKATYSEMGAF